MFPHTGTQMETPHVVGQHQYHYEAAPYASLPNSPRFTPGRLPSREYQQFPQHNQAPQTYAHPLQRTRSHPAHGTNPLQPPQHSVTEHMLRRKTPNGTLAAAYDGSAIDGNTGPPAPKHVLLSASASGSQRPEAFRSNVRHRRPMVSYPSVASSFLAQTRGEQSDWQWIPSASGYTGQDRGGEWLYQQPHAVGIDSVLNQTPFQQASAFLTPNDMRIPTVLQPANQSCLGPTASNGQGPFGPYWPNGAFIPYRPAALRDARFFSSMEHGPGLMCDAPAPANLLPNDLQHPHGAISLTSYQTSTPMHHILNPYRSSPKSGEVANNACPEYPFPLFEGANSVRMPMSNQYNNSTQQIHHPQSFQKQFKGPFQTYCPRAQSGSCFETTSIHARVPNMDNDRTPTSETGLRASNHDFRDKVLCWAHSVYIDLLASLQSRKSAYGSVKGKGQHQHQQRAGIYPRPPRQMEARQNFSSASQALNVTNIAKIPDSGPTKPDHVVNEFNRVAEVKQHPMMSAQAHPQCEGHSRFSFMNRAHNPAAHHDGGAQIPESSYPSLDGSINRQRSDNRHDAQPLTDRTNMAISPIYIHNVDTSSSESPATTNAVAALEMVTKLCSESCWYWVDGMLLAGCLAYGLGDYQKALRWYGKILDVDAKYVVVLYAGEMFVYIHNANYCT